MYLHKTPRLLKWLYPSLQWHHCRNQKVLYLTFDDGPVPGVTEFVLGQLRQYKATATFFCVGDNIRKYPEIFARIVEAGHRVANHTYNHLNGWTSSDRDYIQNIKKCERLLPENGQSLFRPPYGKIKRSQIRKLQPSYRIIMWDVLSGDFDRSLSAPECLRRTISSTRGGSIVNFHDSYRAEQNLRYALPGFLAHFSRRGYQFTAL